MKAGTVVTAEFQGVVSTKRRPAVIVSSEIYHQSRPDIILAVVTSQINKIKFCDRLYFARLAICRIK